MTCRFVAVFSRLWLVTMVFALVWMAPVVLFAEETTPTTTEAAETHAESSLSHETPHGAGHDIGKELPLWTVIPFVGILLSIALFPLLAPHFWHRHFPKVSLFWALVFALPFLMVYRGLALHEILHVYIVDYIPFIILLGGLYAVSGGIVLRGTLVGKPPLNTLLLLIGTLLSSFIGTTGSSMLLIRPVIRANAYRRNKAHVIIFFIFLISNIGGSLTPLGDPPLFLGFLHGVPFQWTFKLLPEMAFCTVILLLVFYAIDTITLKREGAIAVKDVTPLSLGGGFNFVFLLGIVGAVLFSGLVKLGHVNILGIPRETESLIRDVAILLFGFLAYKTTHPQCRMDNGFTWDAIKEVAYLFAGIFMTIIPALAILRAGEEGALRALIRAANSEAAYFWLAGSLSSFLDNAPTYLTYFNTALGKLHLDEPTVRAFLYTGAAPPGMEENLRQFEHFLKAISCGAVFMGANTYIGNAPNFMVRSIAEENHIRMPSFFGYMGWSLAILIPTFVVVTFIFFRG